LHFLSPKSQVENHPKARQKNPNEQPGQKAFDIFDVFLNMRKMVNADFLDRLLKDGDAVFVV